MNRTIHSSTKTGAHRRETSAAEESQHCALTERRLKDRRRHDSDFRWREFRMRAAAQAAGLGVYDLDIGNGNIFWSPELLAIAGLSEDDSSIAMERLASILHPDDRDRVLRKIEDSLSPVGDGHFDDEHRLLRPDGTARWVRVRGRTFFTGEKAARHAVGASGIAIDITDRRAAEQALREQSEELRLALRVGNSGTFQWDAATHEHRWCNEMLALYGLRREEFGGRDEDWLNCLLPEDRTAAWAAVERSRKTGEYAIEFRIRRRNDGEIRWLSARGQISFDTEGRPVRMVGINVDVTERRQTDEALRRESSRLQAILDYAPLLIWIRDLEGRAVLANRAFFETLLVPPPERFLGRNVSELFSPDQAERLQANDRQTLKNDAPLRVEENIRHRDGSMHAYLSVSFPIHDLMTGIHRSVCTMSMDITERKDVEARIQELNAELERRVLRRTAELQRANDALLQSNMDLQHFAHATAHDFQTPLRSIASFTQLIQQEIQGLENTQLDGWAALVVDNTRRLQMLIHELLAYARLEGSGRAFEAVDMQVLVAEVLASLSALLAETGAEVSYDNLPVLAADRAQISQVIQNLFENSIKYNHSTPPKVVLACEQQEDEWIFSVTDNGIGIDPRHHERIFEIFRRLHTYHHIPGSGIGLALCRRILERHGGHIWVDSQPGKGSTFYFSLPVQPETS